MIQQAAHLCPFCGAPLDPSMALKWSAKDRTLSGRGRVVSMGPVTGALFNALWRARGRSLSARELAELAYADDPDGGPTTADKSIPTLLHALRRDVRPFGVIIEATRGPGAAYHLRVSNETEEENATG